MNINLIFDFDSTLVKSETLNEILKISLSNDLDKINEIEKITKLAMEGEITPIDSMNKRLKLATINKNLIEKIKKEIVSDITDNMEYVINYLKKNQKIKIFIISGGFKELILPVAKKLKITENNIYANEFIYKNNIITSVKDNILLEEQGKVKLINNLKKNNILIGKNIMIGDGWTDLETLLFNSVDNYICFTGVIKRDRVIKNSKLIANSSEELLKIINELITFYKIT